MEFNLAYLYPELLNIYGDKGNILAIQQRCLWRGINLYLHKINPGDKINPELYDFYFIGGGQDQQQLMIADELQNQKNALTQAAQSNAVFLAICGGYQLLGEYYKPANKDKIPGLEIMDAYTTAGNKRYIGNVTVNTGFSNNDIKTLVGFENHSGLTYLREKTKPLGVVSTGNGNNAQDNTEGGVYKNVFGTYLHGSLLPKNPHFTDYLINLAGKRKYGNNFNLDPLNDEIEVFAHNRVINKKY